MIGSYIIGIVGITLVITIWVMIQAGWKKAFSETITDEDALAGRGNCSDCHCTTTCIRKEIKEN